jgi:hypothetical protein
MLEFRWGSSGAGALRRCVHEQYEAVGIWEWRRFQENCVDDRKNRRIGSDPKRQSRNRRGSKARALPEHSQGMFDILDERLH